VEKRKGRSRCRWEKSIKTDLTEISWELVNWINVAKVRDIGFGCCESWSELLSIECEEFLELTEDLVSSQVGQCAKESVFSFINVWSNQRS
jgi:hypothetical protein